MELNETKFKNIITKIEKGSIAEELEIKPGDILVSINNEKIEDIIEYKYLCCDEYIEMEILTKENELILFEIEKEIDEDIGIEFENPIIDSVKSCRNKCVFCFIDQLPQGMRDTLYFKDDDSRLSFLQGNFITMTNMGEKEIEKMIRYKISPVNISIHTTDSDLRIKMLGNRFAGNILENMTKLAKAEITMNGQIVLVKNLNDEENLEKTINDLKTLHPYLNSVAVVPIGITKYRENLYPVEIFDKESSIAVINQIHKLQEALLKELGTRFVFLSDEFYMMAGYEMPEENEYEGFVQLENGVGLTKKLEIEFLESINDIQNKKISRQISIATGTSAFNFISEISEKLCKVVEGLQVKVYKIKNEFFGETITVSGLITGSDIINQLKDQDLGDILLIPRSMMKADEDIFLDNITIKDLEKALNVEVQISEIDGKSFVKNVVGI
ncbi:putative radical SAM enzyme (TIGR03279 family) [Acetoanaerobium pronyense]|uniref:Radical SAM enzyme (TIGR03279 family) n=1 Tax=Acetoanaerobium pronyense TaxID=1482736 RepID=A0ABS4KFW8_9FIRM|nr:DUF512 domain-containing protein [Acetoanaerobium pronyense]MBP2026660.1 putative radical SAM enzyme (TIGR03279 family) [Acetoanaerobium pronyense]